MNLKLRLILMNFLQFFVWGSWLITIGAYWFHTKEWSGADFGAIFSTMGIASLFMPAIAGIIADGGSTRKGCSEFSIFSELSFYSFSRR
jgi:MFS transporter, NHS family, xanthosine permease